MSFFFSSRRRHTRLQGDWSSDVCSSDLFAMPVPLSRRHHSEGAVWRQSTEETAVVEEETTETKETEVSEEEREAETEVSPELTKARKVADDQRKRAEKAETELKKLKNGGKDRVPNKDGQGISEEDTARITRSEERSERAALRSMGITHADDIEYVRKAATRLGIDVEEAATDEFVKSKLD